MGTPEDSRTSPTLLGRLRATPDDPEAWREFVRRYGPRIYACCRQWRLQDADAQDVTQEVLLCLARQLRTFQYDPALSFRGYLRTVTRRAWCDFLNSPGQRQRGSGDSNVLGLLSQLPTEDLTRELDPTFEIELLEEACQRVQARVEPHTWETFRLRVFEGLPGAEVASRLGMPVATIFAVQSRVQHMVKQEVRTLEGEEGQP